MRAGGVIGTRLREGTDMIAWCDNLKQLRDQIDRLIERLGPDAPVGSAFVTKKPAEMQFDAPGGVEVQTLPPGEYLEPLGVQVEWVCIDRRTGRVVGDETHDYETRLRDGEVNAVKLS